MEFAQNVIQNTDWTPTTPVKAVKMHIVQLAPPQQMNALLATLDMG